MIKIEAAKEDDQLLKNYLFDLVVELVPSFIVKYNLETLEVKPNSKFNYRVSCVKHECLEEILKDRILPANIFLGMLSTRRATKALGWAAVDDCTFVDDGDIYSEEKDDRAAYIKDIPKLKSLHNDIAYSYITQFVRDVFDLICKKDKLFRPLITITDEELIREIDILRFPKSKLPTTSEPAVCRV